MVVFARRGRFVVRVRTALGGFSGGFSPDGEATSYYQGGHLRLFRFVCVRLLVEATEETQPDFVRPITRHRHRPYYGQNRFMKRAVFSASGCSWTKIVRVAPRPRGRATTGVRGACSYGGRKAGCAGPRPSSRTGIRYIEPSR